jgi:hypothetical protein
MTTAALQDAPEIQVEDLLGGAGVLASALRERPAEVPTTVVLVRLDVPAVDPAEAWVVDPITRLIAWVGDFVGPSRGDVPERERASIAIVLTFTEEAWEQEPHYCEAAAEGLRGVMQSLVAERGAELRCNLAIGEESDRSDLCDLIAFIASEGGRFMSGSRIDLRNAGA